MITTTIFQVGNSYRVKFSWQSLRGGSFTDGYFTGEELIALRDAVERALAQVQELNRESVDVESTSELFARYQEQLRRMVPVPD